MVQYWPTLVYQYEVYFFQSNNMNKAMLWVGNFIFVLINLLLMYVSWTWNLQQCDVKHVLFNVMYHVMVR